MVARWAPHSSHTVPVDGDYCIRHADANTGGIRVRVAGFGYSGDRSANGASVLDDFPCLSRVFDCMAEQKAADGSRSIPTRLRVRTDPRSGRRITGRPPGIAIT